MGMFEKNLGLLRKSGINPLHLWSCFDSNSRSRLDLREGPQLKEKDPQTIPRISKVVGYLQAYIMRPSHGEMDGKNGETPNLLSHKEGVDIEGIKLMIS
jgi:hypothetical protein